MRKIFQNFSVIASKAWQSNTECHSRLSGILQKDSGRAGVTKKALMVFSAIGLLIAFGLLAGCATTPLNEAAERGDINALKNLLDTGVNVNEKDQYGASALWWAAYSGQTNAVRFLLDKGADINAKDSDGRTPLWIATAWDHFTTVKLLLDKGADPFISTYGKTPLKYARDWKKTAIADILTKAEEQYYGLTKDEKTLPRETKKQVMTMLQIQEQEKIMGEYDLAVIIGIENYKSVPKSDYSKSDAGIVKSYLKALGFKERNIEFITDADATKSSIEKSLEAWLPNRVKKDTRVFVYYSGHGAPEPMTGDAYLVPYDGDPNYLQVTGYSLKRLYDNLGKLQVKEVTVVLDSCFSGAGGRSVLAKGARPLVMMTDIRAVPANMAILSATQGTQISTSSPEKGHGV